MIRYLPMLKWTLMFAVASRFLMTAVVPFMDTTEPRYAEIARIMAETGDWITPWFDYGVPFWGKPPLSFWAQALGFKLFGINEFSARLPSMVVTLGTALLIFHAGQRLINRQCAWLAVTIYCTSALGFVSAGAVMTDPFLTLGTTLALVSMLEVTRGDAHHPMAGYGVFIGLAIGLLAKGPLALVLVAVPCGGWLLLGSPNRWRLFPWFSGILLTMAIVLPWYILSELKTPGFLDYFIAGEHFRRFLDPGWGGDLYGSAHQQPWGTIWWYAILASFPWGIVGAVLLILNWRENPSIRSRKVEPESWQALLWLWTLWPLLFFTFAGNILSTYLQPALPSFALLLAAALVNRQDAWSKKGAIAATLIPIAMLAVTMYTVINPQGLKSEKQLVQHMVKDRVADSATLLYVGKPPFSARFYSRGTVDSVEMNKLNDQLQKNSSSTTYVAVPTDQAVSVTVAGLQGPIYSNRRYRLFRYPTERERKLRKTISPSPVASAGDV